MTEGIPTPKDMKVQFVTEGEVEFWKASKQLGVLVRAEFTDKQPDYGDSWLDLDRETLCGQVRAEANRIRPEMENDTLAHRIVDMMAYSVMLYRLVAKK